MVFHLKKINVLIDVKNVGNLLNFNSPFKVQMVTSWVDGQ